MADDDLELDEYGDFVVGDGDVTLVDDLDTLIQDIRHRLITPKGSLPADPDYGVGVQLYLHQTLHPLNRAALVNACQIELAKETRILPQRTRVSVLPITASESNLNVSFVRKADLAEGALTVEA